MSNLWVNIEQSGGGYIVRLSDDIAACNTEVFVTSEAAFRRAADYFKIQESQVTVTPDDEGGES